MDQLTDFFKSITLDKEPKNLYEPIYYTLSQGGKRLRPRLVLMSAELFGGKTELALGILVGIIESSPLPSPLFAPFAAIMSSRVIS